MLSALRRNARVARPHYGFCRRSVRTTVPHYDPAIPACAHKDSLFCVVVGTSLSSCLSRSCSCGCLLSLFACRALWLPVVGFFPSLPVRRPPPRFLSLLLPAPRLPFPFPSSAPSFPSSSPLPSLSCLPLLGGLGFVGPVLRLRFGRSVRLLLLLLCSGGRRVCASSSACLFLVAVSWSSRRSLSTEACTPI